jgi:GNAT superfamily N-acetyltransferase
METENIAVRLAKGADKSRFLPFFDECFKVEYSAILNALAPNGVYSFSSEFLESILPQDEQQMFEAALPDNTLVATGVGVERNKRVYIWGMYVLPVYQRLGLGRRIIQSFCEVASPDSILEVQVLSESIKAQQFYNKLGFVTYQTSREEVFPNVSMLVDHMECDLSTLKVELREF